MINRKFEARRRGNSRLNRELGKLVQKALQQDRKKRTASVAAVIEGELACGKIWDAFNALKGWYKEAGPCPFPPSREEIEATRLEYQQLYTDTPPQSPPLPTHITPFSIPDAPPSKEKMF